MAIGKILKQFKIFLTTPSKNFSADYTKFLLYLDRFKFKLVFDIKKFVKNNLPEIQILKSPKFLAHFQNEVPATNVIENRFNLVKTFLKSIRNIGSTKKSQYLLEIFRLNLNYNRPYTMKDIVSSPTERAGVVRRFSDFSELLLFADKRFLKQTLKKLPLYRKIDLQLPAAKVST